MGVITIAASEWLKPSYLVRDAPLNALLSFKDARQVALDAAWHMR